MADVTLPPDTSAFAYARYMSLSLRRTPIRIRFHNETSCSEYDGSSPKGFGRSGIPRHLLHSLVPAHLGAFGCWRCIKSPGCEGLVGMNEEGRWFAMSIVMIIPNGKISLVSLTLVQFDGRGSRSKQGINSAPARRWFSRTSVATRVAQAPMDGPQWIGDTFRWNLSSV